MAVPSHAAMRPNTSSSKHARENMALVWACLLAVLYSADAQSPFLEPVETSHNVEYYDDGTTRFGIFLTKVTWQEASQLCPGSKGRLAELTSEDVSDFISQALAESAVGFGSLWIGGKFTPDKTGETGGEWKWVNSGKIIDTTLEGVEEFPMNSTPYWVDRPDVTIKNELCLATDRKMHHLPLIVGQPCDRKRPYICTQSVDPESGDITIEVKPPVYVGSKRFHLFSTPASWPGALMQCRVLGFTLAEITTELEFNMISNRMRRSRPIMENAWIGGSFADGKWSWVSSNEPINTDENMTVEGNVFGWYRPTEIIMDGCLMADRHICSHLVYVESQCSRLRPYICQEDVDPEVEPPLVKVVGYPGFWISTYVDTWDRALNVCKVCLDGELVEIEANKESLATRLPMLYSAMAITLRVEIRHVWIGAYLFNDRFMWTTNKSLGIPPDEKELIGKNYDSIQAGGERGTIEYCEVNFSKDTYLLAYRCLDLDRENQKNFFMYGLQCYLKQNFICQATEDAVLDPICSGRSLG